MTTLEWIAAVAIIIGILQAIIIAVDVCRAPQSMWIMNVTWPITGLYMPLIGFWLYFKIGRKDGGHQHAHHEEGMHHTHKPFWQSVIVSTSHCGGGCSIGDLIGAPLVFFAGWTLAGSMLLADYATEFILAYIIGIAFQFYGMRNKEKPLGEELKNAVKADTWSLVSFEIGMFGWMALTHYVLFIQPPHPDSLVFWFMMQVAMMIGFGTSMPANWFLLRKGIKHAM